MSHRPRIAILGRFAASSSATRLEAVAIARRLLELVWEAGGEPITFLPVSNSNWAERLIGIDGVLMPGGGDVNPERYGEVIESDEVNGINDLQDETDISLIDFALANGLPMLTICRGTQIANVALGGTLVQHMGVPHRAHIAPVTVESELEQLGLSSQPLQCSCYHHQIIRQLGNGVTPIAHAAEGHIEAVKYDLNTWAYGLQWHPEDNFREEHWQLEIVKKFIDAARG